MGFGGNRSAFAFSGKAERVMNSGGKTAVNKANIVLNVLDAALSLVSAGASYMRYRSAKDQTNEVRKQVTYAKQQVDAAVEGLRERAELEIEARRKQLQDKLEHQEQLLGKRINKLRLQFDSASKKHGADHEAFLKELDMENDIRKPVKDALDLYDDLLQLAKERKEPFSAIAELQEKHRICAEKYEMLIKRLFDKEVF